MKTKLEMAHDYLRDIVSNWEYDDSFDPVAEAWKYADAMQAEADKREKEEIEKQSVELRNILNLSNLKPLELQADLEEWQPDWSQAPDWASWWSVDENGTANFSGKKPNIEGRQWVYYSAASENLCHIVAPSFNYQGDWRNSLRKRPK